MGPRRKNPFNRAVILGALLILVVFFQVVPGSGSGIRVVLDGIARLLFETSPETAPPDATARIAELEAQVTHLNEESTALKRDLLIQGDTALPRVLGRVLFYDPNPARQGLRMTLPVPHGVTTGDAVLAPGGILVGRVERVSGRIADVLLLSDPGSEVGVRIGETDGLLVGRGREVDLSLTLIPAASAPQAGEVVVTNGDDARIPANLLVGGVAAAERSESDPFARLAVLPLAPLASLTMLTVIPTGTPNPS